jgi:hypothetical protein
MLIALAIVSAPAIAQDTPNPQSSSAPAGFAAPGQVGRYKLGASHDYGKPNLGVAYQYALADGSADSSFATLYLYQREENERGWSADSVLATSVAVFKEGLNVMRNRGDYENYQIAFEGRDSVMVSDVSKLPGYHVAYVFLRGGRAAVSFLYLFVAGNNLVKVRGTVPEGHFQNTDLPSFAHAVTVASVKPAR